MYGRSVSDILGDVVHPAVGARGQTIAHLENQLKRNRPASLPPDVQVAWLRAGTLGLLATSGASAARLRFDSRRLLNEIAHIEGFASVQHIKVLVRPSQRVHRPALEGARLSPKAAEQLGEFAAALPEGTALRTVVEKLSRRSGVRRRSG